MDDTFKAERLHLTPVTDDESFIKRYKALTRILKQCGEAVFGRVKRGGKSVHGKITLPKIQRIQAQIKNIGGALRMDNLSDAGKVSYASQRCFNSYISKFRSDQEKCADFRSFLILHRRKLYKSLYNERMSELYTRAHEADKKRIVGTLLGGSSKRLMASGEYIGLPIAVNSLDTDGKLVTELDAVKSVTCEYWSKLYKQQETPDIPKPWLKTPSVTEVRK